MKHWNAPIVPLGALLENRGLITQSKLREALAIQADLPGLALGEIMVYLGYISLQDLADVLELQGRDLRIGERLLLEGKITRYELDTVLQEQEASGRLLGELLVGNGFCSSQFVENVLNGQEAFQRKHSLRKELARTVQALPAPLVGSTAAARLTRERSHFRRGT